MLHWLWTSENTVDQHQQMTRQPKSSLTVETSHWTSRTWILCLSSLPPDSGTLISKWNATFTFIWKEDFGPLSNSPVLLLFSSGKMLLTMFLVQKWFGSSFPEDVWAWWLLMHWLQLQFTPCEALPSVSIGFAWQYSQACGHLCCLCTFSFPISSFQSTLHLICFDTAFLEQPPPPPPPFSNDPLWLTLFVGGVNDRLLDHCQVSSVPRYCVSKNKRYLKFILYECHLLKLKCKYSTCYLLSYLMMTWLFWAVFVHILCCYCCLVVLFSLLFLLIALISARTGARRYGDVRGVSI